MFFTSTCKKEEKEIEAWDEEAVDIEEMSKTKTEEAEEENPTKLFPASWRFSVEIHKNSLSELNIKHHL